MHAFTYPVFQNTKAFCRFNMPQQRVPDAVEMLVDVVPNH